MTVCIAARCRKGKEDCVILCADKKSSTVLGSAETAFKQHPLPHGWWCLASGDEPDILALVALYRAHFKAAGAPTRDTDLYEFLKPPLRKRKAVLSEDYVRSRFSISLEEFQKEGKGRFPGELFYGTMQSIVELELKASLILVGFVGDEPEIFTTDTYGMLRPVGAFAVSGEGGYIAQSSLLRRAYDEFEELNRALYYVVEAKVLAESVGSVGSETLVTVVSASGIELLRTSVRRDLRKMVATYGPQPVPKKIELEKDIYVHDPEETSNQG